MELLNGLLYIYKDMIEFRDPKIQEETIRNIGSEEVSEILKS